MAVIEPFIPETITVHLGRPDQAAENVTVPFPDYVKNVASSEIYPTWPESALRANIYAIISFALNRYYTEWYPSRGYNFNITNSTAYDQYYVYGRNIFKRKVNNSISECTKNEQPGCCVLIHGSVKKCLAELKINNT